MSELHAFKVNNKDTRTTYMDVVMDICWSLYCKLSLANRNVLERKVTCAWEVVIVRGNGGTREAGRKILQQTRFTL